MLDGATGATNMNDASSRSHAILVLAVAPRDGAPPTDAHTPDEGGVVLSR